MASSGLRTLTAIALVVFAVCFVYEMFIIARAFIPPLVVFAVISLIIAGVVARGWRWGPLVGAVWFVLVFVFSIPVIVSDLTNPGALHQFLWQIVTTIVAIVGFIAAVAATIQNRRGGERGRAVR